MAILVASIVVVIVSIGLPLKAIITAFGSSISVMVTPKGMEIPPIRTINVRFVLFARFKLRLINLIEELK